MTPPTPKEWIYEVALSYAGEQRDYVERVARRLKERRVSIFYDRDDPARLWGTHLTEELARIYEKDAACAVVFASADYADKQWTTWERRAALSRAARERRVYLLMVRFDESPLPGIIDAQVFLNARDYEPEKLADMVVTVLENIGVRRSSDR